MREKLQYAIGECLVIDTDFIPDDSPRFEVNSNYSDDDDDDVDDF